MTRASLLALLLATVLAACEPTDVTETPSPAPIPVAVTTVQRGEIAAVLSVTGQTEALSVLRLASPVTGRVTVLSVRPGDRLDAGVVAARVIPLENEAAVRGFALLEGAGALGAEEHAATRRVLKDLGGRDVPLRTTFPAVVAERLHNPGEQVAQNDVLLELFDPQSLYVLAQVPVESAGAVHPGMPVEVRIGAATAGGQVAALVTAVTPQSLTVPLRVSLSAPLQPPLLHAAVQCRITIARHTGVLTILRAALLSARDDEGVVMVAVDNRAQHRRIRLGLRTDAAVEVTDGLHDGELVLVHGQYALPDGTVIEPTQTEEK